MSVETWNERGRAYHEKVSSLLTRIYEHREDVGDALEIEDPRTPDEAEQVLRAVIAWNAAGTWEKARATFDPAHAPFIPRMERNQHLPSAVVILGRDDLLVVRGSAWQEREAFRLRGGTATPVAGVTCAARSRNRAHLVVTTPHGLELRDPRAFDGPAIATWPWPDPMLGRPAGLPPEVAARWEPLVGEDGALAVERLEVSDDGMRIAAACGEHGIFLASRVPGEPAWQLVFPRAEAPWGWGEDVDEDDDAVSFGGAAMVNVALSCDGTRLAFGEQGTMHYVAEIGAGGRIAWYATVGVRSEYPHDACFSDDGAWVAFNACHFYNGATVAFDVAHGRGAETPAYEDHPLAPLIDDGLRVYASRWLPAPVVAAAAHKPSPGGAFVLAGAGAMRCVLPDGRVVFAQGFGSTAGAIDFCPESGRLALASHSGFVHLYDPFADELPGRIDGWRARRELKRWIVWADLPNGPIAW